MHGALCNGENGPYSCYLEQVFEATNTNKYYIIQLINQEGKYLLHTHWGRIGYNGQMADKEFQSLTNAIKEFEKKFHEKTHNDWNELGEFTRKTGKYNYLGASIPVDHVWTHNRDEEEGEFSE